MWRKQITLGVVAASSLLSIGGLFLRRFATKQRTKFHGRAIKKACKACTLQYDATNADVPFIHGESDLSSQPADDDGNQTIQHAHDDSNVKIDSTSVPSSNASEQTPAVYTCWPHQSCSWGMHQWHVHTQSHQQQNSVVTKKRSADNDAAVNTSLTQQHPHFATIKMLISSLEPSMAASGITESHLATLLNKDMVHSMGNDTKHQTIEHTDVASMYKNKNGWAWQGLPGWDLPVLPLPNSTDETSYVWVDTPRKLEALSKHLCKLQEFAIDSEHHSSHSYLGVTCLLQISTGEVDYLIDTLALWRLIGPALRPSFTSPYIVKVIHGSANDVLWLQRDFHLYLVNVFDTEKAAMVLGLPSRSLASLLATLCDVSIDKRYQAADWRQRPLPPEMVLYARTDVHYLCYIASQLRSKLAIQPDRLGLTKEGLTSSQTKVAVPHALAMALHRSQQVTLQLYRSPSHASVVVAATGNLSRRVAANLGQHGINTGSTQDLTCSTEHQQENDASGLQDSSVSYIGSVGQQTHRASWHVITAQLEALCCWRDIEARTVDVSPGVILHDNLLMTLVVSQPKGPQQVWDLLQLHGGVGDYLMAGHAVQIYSIMRNVIQSLGTNSELPPPPIAKAKLMPATKLKSKSGAAVSLKQHRVSKDDTAGYVQAAVDNHVLPKEVMKALAGLHGRGEQQLASLNPSKQQDMIRKFSAKSPVYSNCRMLSKDGELLCYCDKRKLEWYVSKGIAERVSEDPPTIRLLFEHKNTDQAAGETFYTQSKINRCVVCGRGDHFLRYRVVPSCYRRHFPVALKSHRSHDVVLLCVACHQTAHAAAELTKHQVAQQYGIPLNRPIDRETFGSQTASDHTQPVHHSGHSAEGGQQVSAAALQDSNDVGTDTGDEDRQMERDGVEEITVAPDTIKQHGQGSEGYQKQVTAEMGRRAAVVLAKAKDQIPHERRVALQRVVKQSLGRPAEPAELAVGELEAGLILGLSGKKRQKLLSRLAPEVAQAALAVVDEAAARGEEGAAGGGHAWHGQQVVLKAMEHGGTEELQQLIARFRAAFVAGCQPRFLPPSWDVHHKATREYGDHSVFSEKQLPPEPIVEPSVVSDDGSESQSQTTELT